MEDLDGDVDKAGKYDFRSLASFILGSSIRFCFEMARGGVLPPTALSSADTRGPGLFD